MENVQCQENFELNLKHLPSDSDKCVTLPSLCLSLSTNPEFSHSLSHRLSHSIVFQNQLFCTFLNKKPPKQLILIRNIQSSLFLLKI